VNNLPRGAPKWVEEKRMQSGNYERQKSSSSALGVNTKILTAAGSSV
jgi:hypothetical protein